MITEKNLLIVRQVPHSPVLITPLWYLCSSLSSGHRPTGQQKPDTAPSSFYLSNSDNFLHLCSGLFLDWSQDISSNQLFTNHCFCQTFGPRPSICHSWWCNCKGPEGAQVLRALSLRQLGLPLNALCYRWSSREEQCLWVWLRTPVRWSRVQFLDSHLLSVWR